MVKHATPLLQRASPSAHKLHKPTHPSTRLATRYQNSPCVARPVNIPRSPGPRSRLHSTNTNRFLAERTQLPTINEEPEHGAPETDRGQRRVRYDDTRNVHRHLEAWPRQDDVRAGPSRRQDVDMVGWDDDDETTLVTILQENTLEQDEEERLIAMIESLKGPMAAQGASLKQYMKEAFLPAYNGVKSAHGALEDKVDLAFGAGLLTFDEVCKKVERIALGDEDELKTVHAEAQRNMARTLEELEHAYARRKELWATLEEDINRCATRATAALEGLPTDIEQTIALLEKKAKALDKDTSAVANQKMLRGLLEKL
ncbi:hypothetical protein LXA43DRAFT_1010113 [Ganoderma leucocontextum]|nr:hypothetical protein LXA43DRAFT_1010113 [Ganoderma leucocontextum]